MVKKAFGGYKICFAKAKTATLGDVFGTGDLAPSEMTKKLWVYIKRHSLSKKG
jgi:hypothetical protein